MSPTLCAALIVLLEGLGIASIFPVIHAYVAEFAISETWVDRNFWVGGLLACVALPKVVFSAVWGHWSDRLGRRPVLMLVTLGGITGSIMWGLAPGVGFLFLIVSRIIVGVFGAQAGLAYSIVADVTTPEARAGRMAIVGAAFGVAITVGPIFGGVIGALAGLRAIGWWYAGLQCASLAVITFALRETRPPHEREYHPKTRENATSDANTPPSQDDAHGRTASAAPPTASAAIWLILAATLLATIGMSEMTSTLGVVTETLYGFDTRHVGYAFAFFGFVAALAQGAVRRVSKAIGEKALSGLGMALCGAGFGLLALTPKLTLFLMAMSLVAVGSAFSVTGLTTLMSQAVDARRQGRAIGMNQSATGLGRAIGFFLGSGLLVYGVAAPFGVACGMMALAGLLLAQVRRDRVAG